MTTEEYLRKATRFLYMITNKSNEIQRYRELATSITPNLSTDRVQSSGDKDKVGTIVAKISDLENEVGNLIYFRNRIISQIEGLEDADSYNLLFLKYIENRNLTEIRRMIHVSKTTSYRIYNKAIEDFEKKYGKEYLGTKK